MFTEDKVTEIFCMADDFCKFFDAMMGALAAYCFFPKKPCIACERTIDKQLVLF